MCTCVALVINLQMSSNYVNLAFVIFGKFTAVNVTFSFFFYNFWGWKISKSQSTFSSLFWNLLLCSFLDRWILKRNSEFPLKMKLISLILKRLYALFNYRHSIIVTDGKIAGTWLWLLNNLRTKYHWMTGLLNETITTTESRTTTKWSIKYLWIIDYLVRTSLTHIWLTEQWTRWAHNNETLAQSLSSI